MQILRGMSEQGKDLIRLSAILAAGQGDGSSQQQVVISSSSQREGYILSQEREQLQERVAGIAAL